MARRKKQLTGKEHVIDVLRAFDTLMVGTYEETGELPVLRARPMSVGRVEDDGRISFLTHIATQKVDQALSPRRGHVCGQSKKRWIAAVGDFELSDDRQRIRELWNAGYQVWFDGPDDPAIVLMMFRPETVEIWDNAGAKSFKYAFEMARALITGQKPSRDGNPEQHERVTLQ